MPVPFELKPYLEVSKNYPEVGNHILASYSSEEIIVYQAVPEGVAKFVVEKQGFPPDDLNLHHHSVKWSLRPHFLSVLKSSSWATGEGEDAVLAFSIPRKTFEDIIQRAISLRGTPNATAKVKWEEDAGPKGEKRGSGSISIILKKDSLEIFLKEILAVDDITNFIKKSRRSVLGWGGLKQLTVPDECEYEFTNRGIGDKIGLGQNITYSED